MDPMIVAGQSPSKKYKFARAAAPLSALLLIVGLALGVVQAAPAEISDGAPMVSQGPAKSGSHLASSLAFRRIAYGQAGHLALRTGSRAP